MKKTGMLSYSPFPYSFEGQAHQRPLQSYSGKVGEKSRTELLRHLEDERRRRENARKREASAMKIQSVWRSHRVRKQQQQEISRSFTRLVEHLKALGGSCDVEAAEKLIKLVVSSRFSTLQEDDIQWFASQMLKDINFYLPVLILLGANGLPILFRLKAFLLLVLRRMCASSRPNTAFRLLEVLLKASTYNRFVSSAQPKFGEQVAMQAVQCLITHDYYKILCGTLMSKNDSNLELLPGQSFPSGFSGAILELMLLPIRASKDNEICDLVVFHLVFDVICVPESIIGRFVLPSFLLSDVVEHFGIIVSKCFLKNRQLVVKLDPVANVHVLSFLLSCLKKWDSTDISLPDSKAVIECLAILLRQMPIRNRQLEELELHRMDVTGEDSDEEADDDKFAQHLHEDDDSTVWSMLPEYAHRLHEEVISHFCCNRGFSLFLRRIIGMTKNRESSYDATCQIAQLFYELISRHGVTPSKMRVSSLPIFDKEMLRRFYFNITTLTGPVKYLVPTTLLQRVQSGLSLQQIEFELFVPVFTIFTKFFHWLLLCVHDDEFAGHSLGETLIPFSSKELIEITSNFRTVCGGLVEILKPRTVRPASADTGMASSGRSYIPMFRASCHLLKHLYSRNYRLSFLPDGFWTSVLTCVQPVYPPPHGLVSYLLEPTSDVDALLTGDYEPHFDPAMFNPRLMSITESHLAIVLTNVPFLLPFEYRYDVFRAVLSRDRSANSRSRPMGLDDGLTIDLRVRRQYLYEDAFDSLTLENAPNLKKRVRCQLVNFTGLDEAGIDGGGLFREFITELLRTAFDPNRGLFCFTPSKKDSRLYPNPVAEELYPDNWKKHFFFLGRIVGKLLYEKILVELPLADFFLAKILSRDSTSLDIHHLADLDPILYKNLLFLKTYKGNVEELGLDFTVVDDSVGVVSENPRVIELIPNGKQTPVTADNRILYTHLVADYKLNRRISSQCKAFLDGLSHVINIDWLKMFSPVELQTLISGAEKPINVDDLMAHTRYTGAYNAENVTIQAFWNIVRHRMTEEQRRKLLFFVTSCSRPPMFGFKDLEPPFCIHSAGSPDQNGPSALGGLRLPSASTCINLLKLPEYKDEDVLCERLCYAIESQSGFELS